MTSIKKSAEKGITRQIIKQLAYKTTIETEGFISPMASMLPHCSEPGAMPALVLCTQWSRLSGLRERGLMGWEAYVPTSNEKCGIHWQLALGL